MNVDQKYMQECLLLAKKGVGNVAPNPMVGCVIVYQNTVIGQGYHQYYGEAHAEVNAINAVKNKELLKKSTLYVNLEPCSHFGKTPPCADLIIKYQLPRVIIGCVDTSSKVSGKGIKRMEEEGVKVIVGILEKEALDLNKRFFTFHNQQRPFIILKWAQTSDGFISRQNNNDKLDNWITTLTSKRLVHQWRSEEQAIMVGTNTTLNDNPQLTVREVNGKNPIRIVLDLNLRLPNHLTVFDQHVPTLVFNYKKEKTLKNLEFIQLKQDNALIPQLLKKLYDKKIQSVIIEGGAQLLNTFIRSNLWDEARVFTGKKKFTSGIPSPTINIQSTNIKAIDTDRLNFYMNGWHYNDDRDV